MKRIVRLDVMALLFLGLCVGGVIAKDKTGESAPAKPKTEKESIDAGFAYLVKNQSPDGSWGSQYPIAITAIAGLSFLAHDENPFDSAYADTLLRAYNYMTKSIKDGKFPKQGHTWIHGQGFGTLFLSEFYGRFLLAPKKPTGIDAQTLKAEIEKAVREIERSQSLSGGWWYEPNSPNQHEGSTTVCAVQAMRSAANYGIDINQAVLDKGFEYLKKCQNKDGGFDYQLDNSPDTASMQAGSAGALSTLTLMNKLDYPVLMTGLDFMEKTGLAGISNSGFPYYGHFYAMMAMSLIDKEYGKAKPLAATWLATAPKELAKWQDQEGTWESKGWMMSSGDKNAKCYSTSLALLALLTPNGYLSIFHRDPPVLPKPENAPLK
ncbi:MAG TPA: prenyltransferase/squalene oxidase repeat-containing protein [Planctomycetota bacterium]|nr:prenyltransferase/squalene oxidase repeat-containing protein [Planctomycetota bacterium]